MRYAKWIQRSLPSCLLCLWTKQPVCSAVLCAQHRVLSSPMCSAVPCAQLPRVLTPVCSAQCAQQPRVLSSPMCSVASPPPPSSGPSVQLSPPPCPPLPLSNSLTELPFYMQLSPLPPPLNLSESVPVFNFCFILKHS